MIVTARQLEDLHRQGGSNGHVIIPYRARLSPLAADWIRAKKVVLGYANVPTDSPGAAPTSTAIAKTQAAEPASSAAGGFLWWCDGPCGPAKAAVMAHARESNLRALDKPADAKQLVPAIKSLVAEIKLGRAHGAILLVQSAALATLFTNRCPSLRGVLGTCIETVDQGVQQAAANVLIIEHPYKTLQQVRNLLARFTRGRRELSEDVKRQLQELASCG